MTSGESTHRPDPALIARLRTALARAPRLRLAVLFGSAARGTMHAESDVDVGIIPHDADLPLAAELDLQTILSAACGREAEIVRLDRATTLLRWQAALHGVPLLADPPTEWSRFQARAGIEHAELRVVRDPAAERFRERLARGVEAPRQR